MLDQRTLMEMLRYDPETGTFIWLKVSRFRPKLALKPAGYPQRGRGDKWYHIIRIKGRGYRRSNLAWLYMTGAFPQDVIDHINGNSLDDRWSNLRAATQTQNMWNITKKSKASDLPMGVQPVARSQKFQAAIRVNKKRLHLGSFATIEEADAAYQQARRKYFGEFA